MNMLLTISVIYLTGATETLNIGLFPADYCNVAGKVIALEILEETTATSVAYLCEKQEAA